MIPTSIFEYIDQSDITEIRAEEPVQPLYMYGITADKGTEEALVIRGADFYKMYGNNLVSAFEKHGQPLIQAARTIDAGGKLFVKRVVANDSLLANLAIVAKVTPVETQKQNAEGEPLYLDGEGVETTDPGEDPNFNTPIMVVTSASVKFEGKSTVGKKSISEISDVIKALLNDEGEEVEGNTVYTYPLFIITDNGRGLSSKKFKIVPDYTTSKNLDFMFYKLEVIENNMILDSITFSMDKDVIYLNENRSMDRVVNTKLSQVKSAYIEEGVTAFVAKLASIIDVTSDEFLSNDILFGKSRDGKTPYTGITIDPAGTDLQYVYGLGLVEGTNGTFGTHPFGTDGYETEMVKFYNGSFTDDIYDVDNYKIDLVLDANYPAEVKAAIEDFVAFREDCVYLGDLGTAARTHNEIDVLMTDKMKSKFCSYYHNFYDVIDSYSKKQITVTICYSLATLLVSHFVNGRNRPVAGQLHNMVIPEAIEGTVNYIPKITPTANQKLLLDDLKVNYASYYDGILTIETEYTSQTKYSQFSFLNNILAIQEVIKAVRTRCPKTRYSFIDGEDLENYKKDVQKIIDKYTNNFVSITLEYTGTPIDVANKIFNASLKVKFRDFVQTEYFKVYALA